MSADYDEYAAMVHIEVKGTSSIDVTNMAEKIADVALSLGSTSDLTITAATTQTFNTKGEGGAGER